ncbi:TSCPD domain-containing protein [Chloroflexota bacterium]
MTEKYTAEYIQSLAEDELRRQVVTPLFEAMKFIVYDTHGALEFGKDLVIYNRDSTGEIVYSAVQIKIKAIHGRAASSGNIRTVINQCENAFEIPFIDVFDGSQKFVEKVYVVTSGQITPSATNVISYALRKYGGIRFWGINRLVTETQQLSDAHKREEIKTESIPAITKGYTRRMTTGCGNIYISYSEDPKASPLVFASLSKAGGCAAANMEAITSMISLALSKGATNEDVAQKLRGIRCPSIAWEEGKAVLSCADAIGTALSEAHE